MNTAPNRTHPKATDVQKIVYFGRHGQSNENVAPVFQSPDSALSAEGYRQAGMLAERASRLDFDVLISSPFRRARETADIIAKVTGKQVEECDLFVERLKPSALNGKPFSDPDAAALWHEWNQSLFTPNLRVGDGENYDDLVARADRALAYLSARPEKRIFVMSHGYFLRALFARVMFQELLTAPIFQKFQDAAAMENSGLSVLRYQRAGIEEWRWRLWVYNDHAHLG
jgi:broad specificity phosphatase PhoE